MVAGRIGSIAGWLTLLGIIAFEVVGPMVTIGPRVSGSVDRQTIESYYAHQTLIWFGLGAIVVIAIFIVFATSLRAELARHAGTSPWADVGWAGALVAAALLLTRSGLQMALARGAAQGADILTTFFAWDFIYNAAVYAMEAVYPVAFALALAAIPSTPRWYVGLAAVVGITQLVNMLSLVVGLPEAATLPGNVAFATWLGATAWLLGRPALRSAPSTQPLPA